MVRVNVAGHDRLDSERLGELAQLEVPARVSALVRALELDEEPVTAESLRQTCRCVRVAHRKSVSGAAGEADESFRMFGEERRVERRRQQFALAPERPGVRVRSREEPT